MLQKDLICDLNLYLCEKFGYRNSCSVMQNANGFCVNISERDLDCYIRFWEYSNGVGNFPDWSIIIVRSNFRKNQEENLKTRVRDNILKSKEQKNIQPTKSGHKMVTCQNYVSLFYCQITSCPSDGGIS